MRLTAEEVAGIKAAVAEVFGDAAPVRLFGSRTDDGARGGDIDLLVETTPGDATLAREMALEAALAARIGERKVDIVLMESGPPRRPIEKIALRDGVLL